MMLETGPLVRQNPSLSAQPYTQPAAVIHEDITALIGNTPLLELHRFRRFHGLGARIVAKVEYLNPAGSIKDRTAWAIIREGERSGKLRPGALIFDLTSGNTGIGLAAIGAARGYRTRFYTRDCINPGKIDLLRSYGAEVVQIPNRRFLEPNTRDILLAEIRALNPDGFFADQIGNQANPRIHYETTGPEIWRDTGGRIDALVATVGTGGTVSGVGRYLRERNPTLHIAVVEPALSSLPSEVDPYPDQIEGVHRISDIPPEALPGVYDPGLADEWLEVGTPEARAAATSLCRTEGLFVGLSGGAAIAAAARLAARPEMTGRLIVTILADSGERYLAPPVTG